MTVKKTILCVDDDQSLSIHKLTLETRGYRVIACRTALDALAALQTGMVDLILSAVDLPDAVSVNLAAQAKAMLPDVPIILLSSPRKAFPTDTPVELLLRKDTYSPAVLLDHIRHLLTKRRGPRRAGPASATERRIPAC